MKVTIERATLLKALGHVQSVVERRNTIPILSNVLMRAAEGRMSLSATDLDIEIVESVEATVDVPGAITASAVTLFDIVRKLPDGAQIGLDSSGGASRLTVTAGRSQFELTVLPDHDFPSIAGEGDGSGFDMETAALRRLFERTRFAMSQEETRYYLNGIYLHVYDNGNDEKSLRAVATDGHRLALLDTALPDGAADIPGVIIPRKTVIELRRLLDDAGEAVNVTIAENRICFRFGDVILTSKLIDGTFPDYVRVIPTGNDREMTVDVADFRKAVDRVSTVSADKTRSVKLSIADDQLKLLVNNPETGSATEELGVAFQAEALDIGFNAKYLLDIAEQMTGSDARFLFADSASPTLVKDAEDPDALYVLMPLRV